jgi:tRNA A37 N6-isopentenylltransferase MiaA
MENNIKFELRQTTVENIQAFSQILKKDPNRMLEEALEQYFQSEQQKLIEKNQDDENAMTNLDYDEFWDGIDLD